MKELKIEDKVWRVQKGNEWMIAGPAKVTAIITRKTGTSYLLTWPKNLAGDTVEIKDEQDPEGLFLSEQEAQREADRRHNQELQARMR